MCILLGFFSSTQVIVYPMVIELNPHAITGCSQALTATIVMACGAIFQPLFGTLLQWGHHGVVLHYQQSDFHRAMLLLPIMFAVSCAVALLLKETFCRHQFDEAL